MKQFEIGKTYSSRSICDSNCIYTATIIKRTAKTVVAEIDGHARRCKIHIDSEGEFIIPERYSMAPTYRATRCLNS